MVGEPAMSAAVSWMVRVEAYLAYRRRYGFKLTIDETRLRSFARFADAIRSEEHLTLVLSTAWARASMHQSPLTWARRIEVLRGFARFCLREDPPAAYALRASAPAPRPAHLHRGQTVCAARCNRRIGTSSRVKARDLPLCLRTAGRQWASNF